MKKEEILHKTATFILYKGFSKVSSDELALAAEVSKRTLYKYYPSKDILIESTLNYLRGNISDHISDIVKNKKLKPLEKIFAFVQYLMESTSRISEDFYRDIEIHAPDFFELVSKERKYHLQSLKSIIEAGQKNGSFRKDITAQFAVDLLLVAAEGLLNPKNLINKEYSKGSAHKMLFTIFLEGVLAKDSQSKPIT